MLIVIFCFVRRRNRIERAGCFVDLNLSLSVSSWKLINGQLSEMNAGDDGVKQHDIARKRMVDRDEVGHAKRKRRTIPFRGEHCTRHLPLPPRQAESSDCKACQSYLFHRVMQNGDSSVCASAISEISISLVGDACS